MKKISILSIAVCSIMFSAAGPENAPTTGYGINPFPPTPAPMPTPMPTKPTPLSAKERKAQLLANTSNQIDAGQYVAYRLSESQNVLPAFRKLYNFSLNDWTQMNFGLLKDIKSITLPKAFKITETFQNQSSPQWITVTRNDGTVKHGTLLCNECLRGLYTGIIALTNDPLPPLSANDVPTITYQLRLETKTETLALCSKHFDMEETAPRETAQRIIPGARHSVQVAKH